MVIYGVDITGSLFVSGSSNFKGDINVSGSQIVSGSLNVLNSLLLNGQPFVGTQGPQGIQGSIGIQGTTGSNGAQGNQGPTGIQGTNGTVGTQGNQGPTGLQGDTGSQGNQGPTGLQGSIGAQGSIGTSAGITGYTNSSDNRILTSVNSTTINAESNLTFDGTILNVTGTPAGRIITLNATSGGTITFESSGTAYADIGSYTSTLGGGSVTDFVLNTRSGSSFTIGTNFVPRLTIASTGDATFSSSVTAGDDITISKTTSNLRLFLNNTTTTTGRSWYFNSFSNGSLYAGNTTAGDIFNFSSTGAATFSGLGTFTNATSNNQLTVNGTGAIKSGINFANGGTTYGQIYFDNNAPYNMSVLQQYTTGSLILGTNNNANLTIANGGNVGIGTVSPLSPLHQVAGGAAYTGEARFGGSDSPFGLLLNYNQAGATSGSIYCSPGYSSTSILFKLGAGSGNTNQLVLTGEGNVGIGTATPSSLPYGGGGIFAVYQSGSSALWFGGNQLSFDGQGTARDLNFYFRYSSSATLQTDSFFKFNINTTEAMRITSDGNVGIGTTSPTSNLSFDGSAVRTIGMERVTASNTAGNNLTISASSATVGATDKNGGDVIISGGVATGTGSSRVVFRTATPNFSSGTGDRTPSDKVIITGSGTIIQNGVSSTFVTGTCLANQSVNLGFTTVLGGRVRVHAIITPTDGTSIGAQKMSVIANSTGGISEVVISNTTTTTIGSWTFSGSGTFFGVTKNAGSASTACTYLIEVIGNLA